MCYCVCARGVLCMRHRACVRCVLYMCNCVRVSDVHVYVYVYLCVYVYVYVYVYVRVVFYACVIVYV